LLTRFAAVLFVGNSRLGEYHPFGPFYQEQRAHFALWALFKSPLFIGHDLRNLNSSFVDLLKKKVRYMPGSTACVQLECSRWVCSAAVQTLEGGC
jgi:hypothetical protein